MDWSESKLIAVALALGARDVPTFTLAEERLTRNLPGIHPSIVEECRRLLANGDDPLGNIFCKLRSPEDRRHSGATYTPWHIVRVMLRWAYAEGIPERVVDPGTGSARFLIEAGRVFQAASLVGSELDPVAAIVARANLASLGFAHRSKVILGDFRDLRLPAIDGKTLFIGNPPYVRHHLVGAKWKEWLVREASKRQLDASQLSGLHVHFFLSTLLKAKPHDFGSFITAAEWLDVNYGSLVRHLFLAGLGGQRIVVIEPTAMPFPDATTTAAITSFRVGSRAKSIRLKRIQSLEDIEDLSGGRSVRRERLESERRWSPLTRASRIEKEGYVELGEICRVHRGQVTGANKIWIAGDHSRGLPPSVLFASVTRARELINAGLVLNDISHLRKVIDIPADLDMFDDPERKAIERFLRVAKRLGGKDSFIAQNRKVWWSVGLRKPAPILATYMARRPPAFVRNLADARHINIAHGLYPREALSEQMLTALTNYLSSQTTVNDGRTYAGGLTKFEPREMERILVPAPHQLRNQSV